MPAVHNESSGRDRLLRSRPPQMVARSFNMAITKITLAVLRIIRMTLIDAATALDWQSTPKTIGADGDKLLHGLFPR